MDYKGLAWKIKPEYGDCDEDVKKFLSKFYELDHPTKILEVGANQEFAADILVDNGWTDVTGVDLFDRENRGYKHIAGDFVHLAESGELKDFDVVFSLSAIEHFGLEVYKASGREAPWDVDYDSKAMGAIKKVLKPGGTAYITVPYGKEHTVSLGHWRAYDRTTLRDRIENGFEVMERSFFLSAQAAGIGDPPMDVSIEQADSYDVGSYPHVTAFLKLRKPC